MAASIRSAFSLNFQAPSGFDGKDNNFEHLSFKLKAYLRIMDTAFKEAVDKVEENLVLEVM